MFAKIKISSKFQVDAINKEANDLEQGYGGDKKQEINDIKVNKHFLKGVHGITASR